MKFLHAVKPETIRQQFFRSLKLYFFSIYHAFILALLLSIIAFIPRLLSILIGQDIFNTLSVYSIQRLWLLLINIGALIFFVAMLWRIRCVITQSHEKIIADFVIAVKKFPQIFIAGIIQTAIILGLSIISFTLYSELEKYMHPSISFISPFFILTNLLFVGEFFLTAYLLLALYFYPALILTEDYGIFGSLRRSASLVWGNWWRVFWVQILPWLVYLITIIIIRKVTHINLHIYFISPEQPDLTEAVIHILLFALFIPWAAAALLVQLRDLELRKAR